MASGPFWLRYAVQLLRRFGRGLPGPARVLITGLVLLALTVEALLLITIGVIP